MESFIVPNAADFLLKKTIYLQSVLAILVVLFCLFPRYRNRYFLDILLGVFVADVFILINNCVTLDNQTIISQNNVLLIRNFGTWFDTYGLYTALASLLGAIVFTKCMKQQMKTIQYFYVTLASVLFVTFGFIVINVFK